AQRSRMILCSLCPLCIPIAMVRIGMRRNAMKWSTERILTTHTGSLPRPDDLIPLLYDQVAGKEVDAADLATRVRAAVADVGQKWGGGGGGAVSGGGGGEGGARTWRPPPPGGVGGGGPAVGGAPPGCGEPPPLSPAPPACGGPAARLYRPHCVPRSRRCPGR